MVCFMTPSLACHEGATASTPFVFVACMVCGCGGVRLFHSIPECLRQKDERRDAHMMLIYRYCAQTLEGIRLGHDSTVWAISFSPNGDFFATVSEDTTLKVCCTDYGYDLQRLR